MLFFPPDKCQRNVKNTQFFKSIKMTEISLAYGASKSRSGQLYNDPCQSSIHRPLACSSNILIWGNCRNPMAWIGGRIFSSLFVARQFPFRSYVKKKKKHSSLGPNCIWLNLSICKSQNTHRDQGIWWPWIDVPVKSQTVKWWVNAGFSLHSTYILVTGVNKFPDSSRLRIYLWWPSPHWPRCYCDCFLYFTSFLEIQYLKDISLKITNSRLSDIKNSYT